MDFGKDIKPITYMKTKSAELIKEVKSHGRPVLITQNGEPQAVLQDYREYQRQRDAMMLLRLMTLGEREIWDGRLIKQEAVFAGIDQKLRRRR